MFCKKCGQKIDDDSVFCRSCGARQSVSETPAADAGAASEMNSETDSVQTGQETEQTVNASEVRRDSEKKAAVNSVSGPDNSDELISSLMWYGTVLLLAAVAVAFTVAAPIFKTSHNTRVASAAASYESAPVSRSESSDSGTVASEAESSETDTFASGADSSDSGTVAEDSGSVESEPVSGEARYTWPCEVGTYVTVGRYPQNDGEAPSSIEWLVLENDGETALLLSKYGLDCRPFHNRTASVSWRDSDLRSWLNGEFINTAFSDTEQNMIVESVINTGDSPNGTKGCGETRDKIFCLSMEEAVQYFGGEAENKGDLDETPNRARACEPTEYAINEGVRTGASENEDEEYKWWFGNCNYWLRSPGNDSACVQFVGVRGNIFTPGVLVNNKYSAPGRGCTAVRPAMRIKL